MHLSLRLHNVIVACNVLKPPTDALNRYFRAHRTPYKVALLVNHLFRAAAMASLMLLLPPSTSIPLCLAGSLFYRLTVETHCAYKFALPAFAGASALLIAKDTLAALASGAAVASIDTLSATVVPLLPLAAYLAYITLTVDYDAGR